MVGVPGIAVHVVKIHHQGAGAPSNNWAEVDEPGGYSVGIGPTPGSWKIFRPPWEDYSTLNLNHVVLGVVFMGNRQLPTWPITPTELANLEDAMASCRARGYVTNVPEVSPHDHLAGSNTLCPGVETYNDFGPVTDACHAPGGTGGPMQTTASACAPNAHRQAKGPHAGRWPGIEARLNDDGTTDVVGVNGCKITNPGTVEGFGVWTLTLGKLNQPIGSFSVVQEPGVLVGLAGDAGTFPISVAPVYDA